MLYLGIDQHARQITVSPQNDAGDVLLARQVSTQPKKIRAFFQQLTQKLLPDVEEMVKIPSSPNSQMNGCAILNSTAATLPRRHHFYRPQHTGNSFLDGLFLKKALADDSTMDIVADSGVCQGNPSRLPFVFQ